MFLEFFAIDSAVALLETQLQTNNGVERRRALMALAWQLRQRDTGRALLLIDEINTLISNEDLTREERATLFARMQLISGSVQWLSGELDAGRTVIERALHEFAGAQDAIGMADAHWQIAEIAHDQGNGELRESALKAMASVANGIDPVRTTIAQAALALFNAFRNVDAGIRS